MNGLTGHDEERAARVASYFEDNTWTLDLDIGRPLTMNKARTLHHRTYGAHIKRIRAEAARAATEAGIPPLGRCHVAMHYRRPESRRQDADGLVATLKPICDGLVDAGLVTDDIQELMVKAMPYLDPPGKPLRVYVVITRLPALENVA